MVHAAGAAVSAIADALRPWLPGSCWVDVVSEVDKWSRQEGEAVLDLLSRLGTGGVRQPSLYIISPFREVADRLRDFVVQSGVLDRLDIPPKTWKSWGQTHIGTVHTFQGKEAEAVILVLGASASARRGSRSWAGGTPNILNVAATRAKQVLYVVGRYDAWEAAGVFRVAAEKLSRVARPFDEPAATDAEDGPSAERVEGESGNEGR